MAEIVNKIAQSGLITLDLEKWLPADSEIAVFDLKPFLFKALILREKDFREDMRQHDWSAYKDKKVAVTCSAEAIIPMWAYMLIATYLEPVASYVSFGTVEEFKSNYLLDKIRRLNSDAYADERVIVKGCSDFALPEAAYLEISLRLKPVVKSLMYGEPCSTVPIFKQRK